MQTKTNYIKIKANKQKQAFNESNESQQTSYSRKQAKKLSKLSIKQQRADKSFIRSL